MIRNKRSRSYRSGKTDIANAFQKKGKSTLFMILFLEKQPLRHTLLANAIFEQQEEHNEKVEETGKPKNHLIRKT
ncbi:hypothetical protein X798_01919 [Onchocerca flexuosa]|uniref:Uncharacterized protein n=1 Tax=Onchocerca flexuosa TaxID=387005 RepID=A0A238C0V7_9BILA|nr:hypothetical protein X798_01919 [Onchocerca flexuosa]